MPPDTKEADRNQAEDPDNPEWTTEDFARAVPFKDAHPDLYRAWERSGFQANNVVAKTELALQLSPDIVRAIKIIRSDYNDRVAAVLRDAIPRGAL